MRKYVALLGIVAMGTGAFAADITIYDGQSRDASGWYGMQEDQEVEGTHTTPPIEARTGQQWDLEAFTMTQSNLGMVGGFNFKDGEEGFKSGDIFISLDNAPVKGPTIAGGIPGTIKNTFGYDYDIKLDYATSTYQVFSLTDNSLLTTCSYDQGSNPWTLAAGGTLVPTATNDFTFTSGLTNAQTGFNGDATPGVGSHYAVNGIDLSFITSHEQYFHYTYGCGNDDLEGHHVPEPGSLMLFGTGLLGLIGFAFGRRKK